MTNVPGQQVPDLHRSLEAANPVLDRLSKPHLGVTATELPAFLARLYSGSIPLNQARPRVKRLTLLVLCVASMATLSAQGAAPLTLPDGFPRDAAATSVPLSGEEAVRVTGLEVRVRYPSGWTVARIPPYPLALHAPGGTRALTVTAPMPAPFSIDTPLSSAQLQQLTSALAARNAKTSPRASGQTQLADGRLWVWVESDGPVAQGDWELSPVNALDYERSRIWTFVTTAGGQFFAIHCAVLVTRGATPDQREAQLAPARRECGSMMQTLSTRTP